MAVRLKIRVLRAPVGQARESCLAQQCLSAARESHEARRERLGQPIDFDPLGAASHIFERILAPGDLAHVEPQPRLHPKRLEHLEIRHTERGGRGRIAEEQEEAVAAVDLLPVVRGEQVARTSIVSRPERSGALVAEACHELCAVHQVGEQQGMLGHRQERPMGW